MNKLFTITMIFILPIFLCGCGTIENLNRKDGYPYGGLKQAATFKGPCNVDVSCLLYYPAVVIASPFILADIILSAIGDTVTYPLAKSKESKRIIELTEVLGTYIHNESDCYVSIKIEKIGNEYRNYYKKRLSQKALIEVRKKNIETSEESICDPNTIGKNCTNNVGEWSLHRSVVIGDNIIGVGGYSNGVELELVRINGKITGAISRDDISQCNSFVEFHRQ